MDPNATSNTLKSNKVNASLNRSKKPTTLAPLEGYYYYYNYKNLFYNYNNYTNYRCNA